MKKRKIKAVHFAVKDIEEFKSRSDVILANHFDVDDFEDIVDIVSTRDIFRRGNYSAVQA